MLMDDYPDTFIAVGLHWNDDYDSPWSVNRKNVFYGGGGVPNTWFDGLITYGSQGLNDQDTYDIYLPEIQTRWNKPTDVTVDLAFSEITTQTYRVTATVGIDAGGVDKDIVVHFLQVLDNYPTAPDDRYRNAGRQHDETTISLLAGESTSVDSIDFYIGGDDWAQQEDVKFVVWAQSTAAAGPSEVYNAAQATLADAALEGDLDGDGVVGLADLAKLLATYGLCDGHANYDAEADIDGDGCVQLSDLATLLANYGAG